MEIKILVADDDEMYRGLVCDIIKKEGYIPLEASDGEEALDIFFSANDIELVILDVMMPKCDGWEVLKEIRKYSEVPIMMLTALGDEKSEVMGLNRGADEYIDKPFSYEIFVARINTLLRKSIKDRLAEINYGSLYINQISQTVKVEGLEVELNHKEYQILVYLLKNRCRILTREQFLNSIWGYDFEGDQRTIDTHIKTLRAKLMSCGGYIKTVRGSGYMFDEEN